MTTLNLKQLQVDWTPNGRPLKIRGDIALPTAKSVELAVTGFLKSNATELQLNIDPSSLRVVHKAMTPIGEIIRYQQFINDIPVFNSSVIVQTNQGKIKELNFGIVNEVSTIRDTKTKKLSSQAAYETATKSLAKFELRGKKLDPDLIYYPAASGLRLAYLVLVLTQNPMHDWRLIIDASSGAIIDKEDIIKEIPDGSGSVFDPNPVVTKNDNTLRSPTATMPTCSYVGSTVAVLDGQRVSRTMKDLTLSGGIYSLAGPYAKIIDIASPSPTIPTESVATAVNYAT